MKRPITFSYYYLVGKTYPARTAKNIAKYRNKNISYGSRKMLDIESVQDYLYQKILSGEPFMAARFGAYELNMMRILDFKLKSRYEEGFQPFVNNAGFFPYDIKAFEEFVELMHNSCAECDLFGAWFNAFEEYYLRHYMKKETQATFLFNMEPWCNCDRPWSRALKGKKVLIVHPFDATIEKQYRLNRTKIFPDTEILPEFELKTLKAVQSIGGQGNPQFNDWFEALDYMKVKALSVDFDVAIIGCGAYGFPLAAELKRAGKQAIHLAGATQLLFGIKGKRWDENPAFEYVRELYNENWVRPDLSERPQKAELVEGGCYW